ncbi:actin-7 [Anaeramoeba ignava]|uniref:Actin-7 n=1 Tax=Anaeramoeba ignava TaxID=1746090 RepID=A0A9Q0R8X0_ANAIG|nr:actin-7 [Anaeramoeba ignava]
MNYLMVKLLLLEMKDLDVQKFYFSLLSLEIEDPGIHEITFNSIFKSNHEIRKDLFSNIVLSGGSSLFPGIKQRFKQEINDLAKSKGMKAKVTSVLERKVFSLDWWFYVFFFSYFPKKVGSKRRV